MPDPKREHQSGASVLLRIEKLFGPLSRIQLAEPGQGTPVPASTAPAPALRPRDADRYLVVGELAEGGVGTVYRCKDVDLGRDVAMKVMRKEHLENPGMVARFVEEAQVGGQLQHPGIVPVYELGLRPDRQPYFTMKLVKGRTLLTLLGERSKPSQGLQRYLSIFAQICQTMAYAHARDVIHRDLKPSNIMVGAFGEVQIVDWGFAKVLDRGGVADERRARHQAKHAVTIIHTVRSPGSDDGSGLGSGSASQAGSIMGTPAYMPPEQAQGEVDLLDERSDVFALGAILCEILTGFPPYTGISSRDVLMKAAQGDLAEAQGRLAECGADHRLVKLVGMCLNPMQGGRPRDAGVLARAILSYLESVDRRAKNARILAAKAQVKHRAEHKARLIVVAIAATIILALLGGAGTWLWRDHLVRARAADSRRLFSEALAQANLLAGRARAVKGGDVTLWLQAQGEARRAVDIAAEGHVSEDEAVQARGLLGALAAEQQAAVAAYDAVRRREAVRAKLREIRVHESETVPRAQIAEEYSSAFVQLGLDPSMLSPIVAAAMLRESGIAADLLAALDDWAAAHRAAFPEAPADRRCLVDLAQEADGDPWRGDLRVAAEKRDLEALRRLARSPALEGQPASAVRLLAESLGACGAAGEGVDVLRRGRRVHPGDPWLLLQLARSETRLPQPDWIEISRDYQVALTALPDCLGAWNDLGVALMHAGDYEGAIHVLRSAVERRPDFVRALYNLSLAYDEAGRRREAEEALTAALRTRDDYAPAHRRLGFLLKEAGQMERALVEFEKAARLEDSSAGWRELSLVYEETGAREKAMEALHNSLVKDGADGASHYHLGRMLEEAGNPAAAREAYRQAIKYLPENFRARQDFLRLVATSEVAKIEFGRLRTAVDENPEDPFARFDLGTLYLERKELSEAVRHLKEAVRLLPGRAQPLVSLGFALKEAGDFRDALTAYEEAVRLEPRNDIAMHDLGATWHRLGDTARAIECYRQAAELNPDDPQSWFNLAFAHQERGDYGPALDAYRQALRIRPDMKEALEQVGVLLCSTTREKAVDEAVDLAERAIAKDPRSLAGHRMLGYSLGYRGSLADARRRYEERFAESTAECQGEFYNALGVALSRKGSQEESNEAYKVAIDCAPDHEYAVRNLAGALTAQNRAAEALEVVDKVLAQRPDCAWAYQAMATALEALGDRDRSVKAWRDAHTRKPDDATLAWYFVHALVLRNHPGDTDEALKTARSLLAAKPYEPYPHQLLGYVLGHRGGFAEALAAYGEEAKSPLPSNEAYFHYGLGVALNLRGLDDDGVVAFREAVRLYPETGSAMRDLVSVQIGRGRVDEAIADCLEQIRKKPDFLPAHVGLGLALQVKRDKDRAVEVWRSAFEVAARHWYILRGLVLALMDRGRPGDLEEVEKVCLEAIRQGCAPVPAAFCIGAAAAMTRDFAEVRDRLQEILPGADASARIMYFRGLADRYGLRKKDADAARACLEAIHLQRRDAASGSRSLEPSPVDNLFADSASGRDWGLLAELGQAVGREGTTEDTDAFVARELPGLPDDDRGVFLLGYAVGCLDGERPERGEAALCEAIRLNPRLPACHSVLGQVRGRTGTFEEGEAAFRRAVPEPTDSAELAFYTGLADTLFRRGDVEGAERAYRQAVRRNRSQVDLHQWLTYCLSRLDRHAEAIHLLEEYIGQATPDATLLAEMGWALGLAGAREEALAAYRKGLDVDSSAAWPNYGRGLLELHRGRFEEALPLLHRANSLFSLSEGEEVSQLFREARTWVGYSEEAEGWVRECRRMIEFDGQYGRDPEAAAKANGKPPELVEIARYCLYRDRSELAGRILRRARKAGPSLFRDLDGGAGWLAVRVAALAATAKSGGASGEKERAAWRKQALEWLTELLAAWEKAPAEPGRDFYRNGIKSLWHFRFAHPWAWRQDPLLLGLRHPEALAQLPPAEREAWRKAWADVDRFVRDRLARR